VSGNNLSLRFDFEKFYEDYDNLAIGEVIATLYHSGTNTRIFANRFTEAEMEADIDYWFRSHPVMASGAIDYLGRCVSTSFRDDQFEIYSTRSKKLMPDPVNFPLVHAFDQAVPRRSNRSFASDTLPRVADLYQVYIEKLSDRKFNTDY